MKKSWKSLLHIGKTLITEEWKGWKEDMAVQLVGVVKSGSKYQITSNGQGVEVFKNLADARKVFPKLDPVHGCKNFTWAMSGTVNGRPAIRFETWAANELYSR
jgi:hypothetical protein